VDEATTTPDLLAAVRRFHRQSVAGRYRDGGPGDGSSGDEGRASFVAQHRRLVQACLEAERAGELATAREGLARLLDLARALEEGDEDILSLAEDEGDVGASLLGLRWDVVLPAWFRSLSPELDPLAWAEAVVDTLDDFVEGPERAALFRRAWSRARPDQRDALAQCEAESFGGWRDVDAGSLDSLT